MKRNGGYTLVELLFTIFIIAFVFIFLGGIVVYGGVICAGVKGNFWFNEDTLLKATQRANPSVVRVVDYQRCIWSYSTVEVEDNKGDRLSYDIDTNIAWDAKAISVSN